MDILNVAPAYLLTKRYTKTVRHQIPVRLYPWLISYLEEIFKIFKRISRIIKKGKENEEK